MRGRRGGASSPLSLFSFQDIITGISGIMILIVLMMVLDLMNTKVHGPPPPPPPEVKDLKSEIAGLKKKIADLKNQVKKGDKKIKDFQTAKDEARRTKTLKDQLANLLKELAGLKTKLAECSVIFVLPVVSLTDKIPIMVVCSGKDIKAKVLRQGESIQNFPLPQGTRQLPATSGFLKWALARDPKKEQFVFIFRPSAAPYGQALLKTIKSSGFVRGHEPIEEARPVGFPGESPR